MTQLARAGNERRYARSSTITRCSLVTALLACLAFGALKAAPHVGASTTRVATSCATATRAKPITPLTTFPAIALPAGTATGAPSYAALPAGFTLKHTHGGPTYVYVISGDLAISDNTGTVTYCAGSFFSEPPGHVHTLHVVQPSEIFVLQFLPPGADGTIPVQ
jgi:quercetin dioxygenase-like cupin family protein